ncbi:MAG: TIGR02099 family protein [Nitrosomonadales bacterium]|nr:TIGR02099 family protein [Nitrosomonadales bacterium]
MLRASLRLAWKGLGHLARIALVGTALVALACAGLMLGLRYWILPDIERYRGIITVSASQAIGQPVSIGKIEADWQGIRPHLSFTDVRILDKRGQTALALPRVDNVVSWATLLAGEVRLHSIELDRPNLLVRRDAQGLLYIAGMALSGEPSDKNLSDWLLHQARIVVRDARITWQDEQRAAAPLAFDQVNLLVENSGLIEDNWLMEKVGLIAVSGRRHRFAVRALPPAELSAQLDVRGDFYGNSFDDLRNWRGQLFAQLDYVDVGAWRAWLPLPAGFRLGKGALRGWMEFGEGKANRLTTDLVLADVRAQLGEDLPVLDLRALRGRLDWQESAQGMEISARKFSLQMNNGLPVQPTDFFLRLAGAGDRRSDSGELRANTLDLAGLTGLADYLPLGQDLRKRLAEFAPQGLVAGLQTKWQSEAGKLAHYDIKAQFDRLSLRRTDSLPGFSGLSGEVDGNERGGTLSLNARKLVVDAPHIMPEPLQFDTLTAQSGWQSGKDGLEVKFGNVSVANADVAGTLFGSYRTVPDSPGQPKSPGIIDLTIALTRADVHHADRYIPLAALGEETHAWIRDALLGGQASEFRLRLHGDLNDFPFPENRKGIFSIRMRARDVSMEYAREWPRLENITAELLVQGNRLEVIAPSAATVGARLQKVSVVVPDTSSPDLLLQVRGEALAETAHGLDFIQKSPVRGYIDGFTDGMAARGNGKLALMVDVPLQGGKPAKVSGSYRFSDNEMELGEGVPTLRQVNGELLFTESSLRTRNASAQILGGPATLSVQSGADGAVQARLRGKTDMDALRKTASHPLLAYLHGGSEWEAEIQVQKKLADVVVTSNLDGLSSSLPEPFAKGAGETVPVRFEMKSATAQQDTLSLQYGKLFGAKLLRREEGEGWIVKRGTVSFGGTPKLQLRDGVWLTGTVPKLSLEGWGPLLGGSGGTAPTGFAGAELLVQSLDVYGYQVNDLRINARNQNGALAAQLASREANGEVIWQGQDKGKLHARLKNLFLDKGESGNKEAAARKPVAAEVADKSATGGELPALDLAVEELTYKGKPLGRMELLAQHHGRDWLLERMRITNPDGLLTADGKWGAADGKAQTRVNLKLEIGDAGKILARSGYPDSVRNGSGKLDGAFVWQGGPDDFSYATLDGTLKLDTGKGQFLKIKPGIGKLLGILSLQALPRHITLDFTDVFSEGFAFDSITGTAQIRQGVLSTGDFKIDGSAAKVTMAGQIDLGRETQNLNVRILPTVGNSVSMLGAFTGGPLVGIGTFIVNKLLREPLDKLVSFEYNVTGTWENPNVVKVGAGKPAAADNN